MKIRKTVALLLVLLLGLSLLAGCGKGKEGGKEESGKNETVTNEEAQDNTEKRTNAEGDYEENEGLPDDDTPKENPDDKEDETDTGKEEIPFDDEIVVPDETIAPEEFRPDDDFIGIYENDSYTAYVGKNEEGMMAVVIQSKNADADGALTEWYMIGTFSHEAYWIRYYDAVKSTATYKDGQETGRTTIYTNGSGILQFADTKNLHWVNESEQIENKDFQRIK